MKGSEFIASLFETFTQIGPTGESIHAFSVIGKSLDDSELIDSFSQIKKNEKGEGLALEIMFFDEQYIHDIVFTNISVEYVTVLIKTLNTVNLYVIIDESHTEDSEKTITNEVKLLINYEGGIDGRGLMYISDLSKLSDFIRIKSNLLKIIK